MPGLQGFLGGLSRLTRPTPRPVRSVPASEYMRLLGYPPQHELDEHVEALAQAAFDCCERHAQPACFLRVAEITGLTEQRAEWSTGSWSGVFESRALARRLRAERAQALALVVVSAGHALDERVRALETAGDLVPTYFLDRLAAAWCEELLRGVGGEIESQLRAHGGRSLAPLGPGHEDWDVAEQAGLLSAWESPPADMPTCNADSFLEPRYALSAVFGLTSEPLDAHSPDDAERTACAACSHHPCSFRRPTRGLALTPLPTP